MKTYQIMKQIEKALKRNFKLIVCPVFDEVLDTFKYGVFFKADDLKPLPVRCFYSMNSKIIINFAVELNETFGIEINEIITK